MSRRAAGLSATLRFQIAGELRLMEARGAVKELLGYCREQLLSQAELFADRIHPEDADLRARLFEETGAAEGVLCLRVRHADGKIRCLEARFARTAECELKLELRRPQPAEDAIRSSGCLAMLQSIETGAFLKDCNHVYAAANAPFLHAIARFLDGRELVGLTDYDLLPEVDADQYYRSEKHVLANGASAQQIHEIVRPEAANTWIHARLHPVKDERGRVEGVFVTVSNLTARLEGEAREEPGTDATTGKDRGPEMGTYVLDMRKAAFATSANLDAILGIDQKYPHNLAGWEALIHPDDRERVLNYFAEVIAAPGRVFSYEYRVLRGSDGELRWVHGIGRVVRDSGGMPVVMRGTVQDITARKQMEAALRETKERLQIFVEHAPAALAMFDREMRYLAVSQRWLETYRLEGRNVVGMRHYEVNPDIPDRWKATHQRAMAGEAVRCNEDKFERADGTVMWLRWEVLPWHAADGSVGGISIFLENITAAKEAEARLQLAATLFEQASEAFAVTDLNGSILRVNHAFTRVLGYESDEVLGRHIEFLKAPDGGESFYSLMSREVARAGRWRGELRNRAKDGRQVPVACTITTVRDSEGNPKYYVCMFFDISPIKDHERRLEHMIRYDALTGLPNRLLLTEQLRREMAEAQATGRGLALAAFDLDGFKKINDRHGKMVADSLLMNVASRMKQLLREGDTLGRPGGDEFAMILRDAHSAETVAPLMQRVFAAIAEPLGEGAQAVQLSVTGGVAFYPQGEDVDADQLWRQADQALYDAKVAGKNRYFVFDVARDHRRRGREGNLEEIRQGLGRGEFVLHFQPKVNMATGEMIGVEALVRWQHPERGLLPPTAFLPLIEEHELSVALGEWVIETALAYIEGWALAGHDIRVNVNVSPHHLQQSDFLERLKMLLAARPGADPRRLGLEVLESSMVQDVEHVSRIIESCGAMGIRVAIDDFGTGYSALTYLKRLPAQVLKIDQSFVRGMLEHPGDLAIVQGVLGLASAFRRMVVAEGVETVEHGILLLLLGCTFGQGYGIAQPMPADELLQWSACWQPDPRWKQIRPLSSLDWPLLAAGVELRAWEREFHNFMAGASGASVPELDEDSCRLRAWLQAEKQGPRAAHPALQRIDSLHTKAHEAARRAVVCKQRGDAAGVNRWVEEAMQLRRRMREQIDALVWESGGGRTGYELDHRGETEIAAKLQ